MQNQVGVLFNRQLVDVTGDIVTTLLLSQIIFWNTPTEDGKSKLRVKIDGKLWLAKSYEEWFDETGLTEYQARRAIKKLEQLGLIKTCKKMFARFLTVHIFLEVGVLKERLLGLRNSSTSPKKLRDTPLNTALSYTENTAETTTEIKSAGEPAYDLSLPKENRREEMKAMEILEQLKNKPKKINWNAMGMMSVWQTEVGKKIGFAKPYTKKELGQMGQFLKKAEGRCIELITWSVENWGTFAFEARTAKGLKIAPDNPVIGFLLEHFDVAVLLLDKHKVKSMQSIAKPIDKLKEYSQPTETAATIDEVLALMGVKTE